MIKRLANSDVQQYVNNKEEFETSNKSIFSHITRADNSNGNAVYAVYSYGHHFPMYLYDYQSKEWYGNEEKYSRTTTNHQSRARPSRASIAKWFDTDSLKNIIDHKGLANWVMHKGGE